MARSYRPVDRAQEFLLPPSMLDWLAEDHLVWFVMAAVERLDTGVFHRRAKLGGVGRRGYDPDMLLTLFVYAMAHGERSSRRIERLCHTDVAFRVICAGDVPDHSVLARFRKDHVEALTGLLGESLVLAAQLGMVSLGVVAFDGVKIAANASRYVNHSEKHLRGLAEQFVSRLDQTDAAEDAAFGADSRGDELPPRLRDRTGRGERIGKALQQIEDRRTAAEQAQAKQAERDTATAQEYLKALAGPDSPPTGAPPKGADPVAVAEARWRRERARAQARIEAWEARTAAARAAGRNPKGCLPVDQHSHVRAARAAYDKAVADAATGATGATGATDQAAGSPDTGDTSQDTSQAGCTMADRANLTDPESRLLKTRNGWVQGYNCQTAISGDEFIIAARATQSHSDAEQFEPTVEAITAIASELARRTSHDFGIGTMIGDAGYDSTHNLTTPGPDRLIPDAKRHAITRRATGDPATGDPPEHATAREKMNHRLRTPQGHTLYTKRGHLSEAPHAWLKDRRGLRSFAQRGLTAAQAELSLAAAVTNLLKLRTSGITTTQLATAP